MQPFIARSLPRPKTPAIILAGLGGAIAIALLLLLGNALQLAMVIAPFGASCVLIFGLPTAPLSQPANVVGGHVVSAAAGMVVFTLFPDFWWYPALGVGLAISCMAALRVTHPPAGANPLVIFALEPSWWFLAIPVLLGSALLVVIGVIYHRLTGGSYPIKPATQ
ncbi:MAG: HPP family protein [Pseudomonadota bacterium]